LQATTAPNLPVDEERFLLYLNREGKEARIDYPNIFDIVVTPSDTDEAIINKISTVLTSANAKLVPGKELAPTNPWNVLIQPSISQPNLTTIIL
jgi:hypothetical protein